MRYATSCGIIPLRRDNETGTLKVLLVQGHGNYWGFPKGKREGDETYRQTALRELEEETQLVCSQVFSELLYTERYRIKKKRGADVFKKVFYYVGIVETPHVRRQRGEIKKALWLDIDESFNFLTKERRSILKKALKKLEKRDYLC
jgi:8-oxo-dGTP pyrophosphatase MutT (NUDIX family)